jgi:peptide deformylase
MPQFQAGAAPEFPIVQLPAQSLWCIHDEVPLSDIKSPDFQRMLQKLHDTRRHYQYPSMSAPQIGWNVSVFVLSDGSVWINPKIKKVFENQTCWSWEPCASCAFLMHYIERPHEIVMSRYDENGKFFDKEKLDGIKARFVQHEMDHLTGILFTRRIPNSLHVVPMDGFHGMSDWAEDYPSIEARSTNLYTLFFAPHKFVANFVEDSEMLKRHYEDNIFPGHEVITQASQEEQRNNAALQEFIEEQKKAGLWRGSQFSHNKRNKSQ